MPIFLLTFVEGLVGPKFAKPLIFGVLGLLLIAAFFGLKSCYDHGVVNKHEQQIQQRAAPATNEAAAERANDNATNAKNEKEAHDAVHSVPDAAPAGPSHQLACQRLRHAGRRPASC